jgi:hypothetical protein
MKKIIVAIFILAVFVQGAFGQTTANEWFERAGEYLDSGDWNNAIRAYSEVINRDRSNFNAFFLRGVAYSQIGNYDASIADFNIAVNGAPNFPDIYILRGFAYGAMGMFHKAIADYRTALEKGFDPTGGNWNVANSPNVPSSMWLLGYIHMEIVVNRFLGNTAAVTRFDNLLRTLCNDTNVTRAEIETFYRNNIRACISGIVDEEFNKISFYLGDNRVGYNAVLTRNPQNRHYVLSYGGVETNGEIRTVSGNSLEALSSAMRDGANKADFTQLSINQVRTQAALIPAVTQPASVRNEIANLITAFYLSPNRSTFDAIYARYDTLWSGNERNRIVSASFIRAVQELHPALADMLEEW